MQREQLRPLYWVAFSTFVSCQARNPESLALSLKLSQLNVFTDDNEDDNGEDDDDYDDCLGW